MIQNLFTTYNHERINEIHKDDNYWALILLSVAQGRIDTARHLLSFHPDAKFSSVFKAIDDQLRTMPTFTDEQSMTTSIFEFRNRWEYWQKKSIQILTNETFTDETVYLQYVCKMLCGDEQAFLELKDIFGTWYYMLISLFSFSNPTFNISDLHLHLSSRVKFIHLSNIQQSFCLIYIYIFFF